MFLILYSFLLVFCIYKLTIKLNYLFIAASFIVAASFIRKMYYFFTGGNGLDIICGGLLIIGVLINLLVLGSGIYKLFKENEYIANLQYTLLNILVVISLYLISQTYEITFTPTTGGSFVRTPLYFFYAFIAYILFFLMGLMARSLFKKKKDIEIKF